MNDSYKISVENLMHSFPTVLGNSKKITAIAKAVSKQLVKNCELTRLITIYSRIDELPENLLDILAKDFKVDWWDPNYTLEEKRATLKSSWRVHRTLGTVGAIETAMSAIYPGIEVSEWFDYGGEPYRFKLIIGEAADEEKHERVLEKLKFYKNARSKLDDIIYFEKCNADINVLCAITDFGCTNTAELSLI